MQTIGFRQTIGLVEIPDWGFVASSGGDESKIV